MPKLHKNWEKVKSTPTVHRWQHSEAYPSNGIVQVTRHLERAMKDST